MAAVGDDEVDAALMLSAHTAALTPRFDYRSLYRDYDAAERARIADAALALTTRSAQRAHWAQRMPWDPHVDTLNREAPDSSPLALLEPFARMESHTLHCFYRYPFAIPRISHY